MLRKHGGELVYYAEAQAIRVAEDTYVFLIRSAEEAARAADHAEKVRADYGIWAGGNLVVIDLRQGLGRLTAQP